MYVLVLPFLFLPCQAMVDVDETYREPLLGKAFYHEKALTVSRVGDMTLVGCCMYKTLGAFCKAGVPKLFVEGQGPKCNMGVGQWAKSCDWSLGLSERIPKVEF